MNDGKIVMKTNSGYTVIERRMICAVTLQVDWEDTGKKALEIHMVSGTIFTTEEDNVVEELWYQSAWGTKEEEE